MPFRMTPHADERKTLLNYYRTHPDPAVRRRCQLLLLLADGHPGSLITAVLFCRTATIARWKQRFEHDRVPDRLGRPRGPVSPVAATGRALVVDWVLNRRPRNFGFQRSR